MSNGPRIGITIVLLIVATTSAAWADTVTLAASADNTLFESASGALSNGSGDGLFVGNTNNGQTRRALLAFDIAGNLPSGSTINSVSLTLQMSRTNSGAQTVELRRVSADWGEGSSDASGGGGQGTDAAEGDATWIHTFFDMTHWQNAGGDFADTASASTSVDGAGSYTWGSSAAMVADLQAWLDDASTNFGWILIGNEAASPTTKRFDAREHATAANRPMLAIDFTPLSSDGAQDTNTGTADDATPSSSLCSVGATPMLLLTLAMLAGAGRRRANATRGVR